VHGVHTRERPFPPKVVLSTLACRLVLVSTFNWFFHDYFDRDHDLTIRLTHLVTETLSLTARSSADEVAIPSGDDVNPRAGHLSGAAIPLTTGNFCLAGARVKS